ARHRADAASHCRSETAMADRSGERRERRVGDVVPVREAPTEIGVGAVAVRVAGVLREHRQDELLERRQVSRWWRCAIRLSEATRDGAEAPAVHSTERIGNCGNAD